jgi:hypothetical protein
MVNDFNGNEIKVGDRVEKARVYSPEKYCRHGGSSGEVPIGTRGTIRGICSDYVRVVFDSGKDWQVDKDEINRVYCEKDFDFTLDSVGNKVRVGDIVERINNSHMGVKIGDRFKVMCINKSFGLVRDENETGHDSLNIKLVVANTIVKGDIVAPNTTCRTEGNKMEIKDMKKQNINEAKKQFDVEKNNAEVEDAKRALRLATDKINEIDRQIKTYEESKKPYLEILGYFK